MSEPPHDGPPAGWVVTEIRTKRRWILEARGGFRAAGGFVVLVGVLGTVGLVWAGLAESALWLLWLPVVAPVLLVIGAVVVKGRIEIPVGESVELRMQRPPRPPDQHA